MEKNKKPLPMPIDMVLLHPATPFMTGLEYRALITICAAYWLADCPSMALNATRIRESGRFSTREWNHALKAILKPLQDILPVLAHSHAMATQRRQHLSTIAKQAGFLGHETQRRLRQAQHSQAGLNDSAPPSLNHRTPRKAKPHTDNRAPQSPVSLALLDMESKDRRTAKDSLGVVRLSDE